MNSKEALIEKIVTDAKTIGEGLIQEAEAQAQSIQNDYEREFSDYRAYKKDKIDKECKNIIERKITVAELDAKKIELGARREILDDIFDKAEAKILKLDDKSYLKFIEKLLTTYAEDNDEVVISKTDKDKITDKFIESVSKKIKKSLTLSKKPGTFNGGIILSNGGCDKNLTLSTIVRQEREQIEIEVQTLIFEEK